MVTRWRSRCAPPSDIDTGNVVEVMRCERWRGPSKDGGPSAIGRQGIVESAPTFAALRSSQQTEGVIRTCPERSAGLR
jgi:hypothetical protein